MNEFKGYEIRPLTPADQPFLWEMLYQSLYVPKGHAPFERSIIEHPDIAKYVRDWGRKDDSGFVGVDERNRLVGAIWLRLFKGEEKGFGYVDDGTPELGMAVLPEYRGKGVGTRLLSRLLESAEDVYENISLSVAVGNAAIHLYERAGFKIVRAEGSSIIMKRELNVSYATREELEGGMAEIRRSPKTEGLLRLIVRRPAMDEREVLDEGQLDILEGLVGDTWRTRGSSRTDDGSSHPDMQINIINARVIELLAGSPERWPLAGDQLYVDFDLSQENLPPGTRLCIGTAVIVVTNQPHTGCGKFSRRFGPEALKFVNTPEGRRLNLRGINARVVQGGVIRVGDTIKKITT